MQQISKIIAEELKLNIKQVEATIDLINEGKTIPFIARYRKEVTGNLSDEVLRILDERLKYIINLEERKQEVIKSIKEQEKLTDELEKNITNAKILAEVEDLYRPYKQKKRTRAIIAKEKGLEPLANMIYEQKAKEDIYEIAKKYINEEKNVESTEQAISGALDIIAEVISDNAEYRKKIKFLTYTNGLMIVKAIDSEEKSNFEFYYDYNEPINNLRSHRILAINRGENLKILKVKLEKPEKRIINIIEKDIIKENTQFTEMIKETILDSYKRLIEPAIDREIRSNLTEKAEEQAIKVFGKNVKQLLLLSPIKDIIVLGIDPGFRTGCKIAVIDETGKLLDTGVIYVEMSEMQKQKSKETIIRLVNKYSVNIIAIGNGTASRETEMLVSETIENLKGVHYTIVSEAGASVYSASKLATQEYPDIDVSIRGAISIARRLQDPLAELVKIDPKSIGVGQYQHDVNQKRLEETLQTVVEDAVNKVGVDINTATPSLLSYVAGINKKVADNIVKYRDENGKFKQRKDLLKVKMLGNVVYEQCAGFTRIYNGENPLENTAVHPESYEVAKNILEYIGYTTNELLNKESQNNIKEKLNNLNISEVSEKLQIGEITLKDIVDELIKPGRDPREDMPKPILREGILKLENLQVGTVLKGTVRNVTDFGIFIDIGLKRDGFMHKSQINNLSNINISVGDILDTQVINIDEEKQRISLGAV